MGPEPLGSEPLWPDPWVSDLMRPGPLGSDPLGPGPLGSHKALGHAPLGAMDCAYGPRVMGPLGLMGHGPYGPQLILKREYDYLKTCWPARPATSCFFQ